MTITIDVSEVLAALKVVEDLEQKLAPQMDQLTDQIRSLFQVYPAVPSGSSYQRTERLKNSWLKESFVSADSLTGRVWSSGVDYAGWVQGHEDQAAIHRGRWDTNEDVAEKVEPYAVELFAGRIQIIIS